MEKILGNIHSVESFGTLDGPGMRFVIFMQGCDLRCQYCHNPDTWSKKEGRLMSSTQILDMAEKYRAYWKEDGGITVSGGEPLLQIDFVIDLFEEAKQRGINTCIDTAGEPFDRFEPDKLDRLMKVTDLVLLDIKHIDDEAHKKLTGKSNENTFEFAKYLDEQKVDVVIRYVLVPGINEDETNLRKLREFLDTLSNIVKVEVLPYHTLGIYKWENLKLDYPLYDTPSPTDGEIAFANKILNCL